MISLSILSLALMVGAEPTDSLVFTRTVADRGEIRAGAPLVESFKARNNSKVKITVTSLTGGCGCLKPKISSQIILPGEEVEVRFEVNTLSQPVGANTWALKLRTRAEGETADRETILEIRAKLIREVTVEPAGLVVVTSEGLSRDFRLIDARQRPLKILKASSSIPAISLHVGEVAKTAPMGIEQKVTLDLPATAPSGLLEGSISLWTDDPNYPEIRIPVQIVKRAESGIQFTPDPLVLRLAANQSTASGIVRVRDAQDEAIEVDRIESNFEGVTLKHVPGPGKMATLRLGVDLKSDYRSGEALITVFLKKPRVESIVVPLAWRLP